MKKFKFYLLLTALITLGSCVEEEVISDCDSSVIEGYLVECNWSADYDSVDVLYDFNSDGTFDLYDVGENNLFSEGEWNLVVSNDDNYLLTINEIYNGTVGASYDWQFTTCDLSTLEVISQVEWISNVNRDCETVVNPPSNCSEEFIQAYLTECTFDILATDGNILFYNFLENGDLSIEFESGAFSTEGEYIISTNEDGEIIVTITEPNQDFNAVWTITCDEENGVTNISSTDGYTETITQNCDTTPPPSTCTEEFVEAYLIECKFDILATDDNVLFYTFLENGDLTIEFESGAFSTEGEYIISTDSEGVIIVTITEPSQDFNAVWTITCDEENGVTGISSTDGYTETITQNCD